MDWEKDYGPKPVPAATSSAAVPAADNSGVPGATSAPGAARVPANGAAADVQAQLITITTDVLRLTVDTRGGSVVRSELMHYPSEPVTKKNPTPAPVRARAKQS